MEIREPVILVITQAGRKLRLEIESRADGRDLIAAIARRMPDLPDDGTPWLADLTAAIGGEDDAAWSLTSRGLAAAEIPECGFEWVDADEVRWACTLDPHDDDEHEAHFWGDGGTWTVRPGQRLAPPELAALRVVLEGAPSMSREREVAASAQRPGQADRVENGPSGGHAPATAGMAVPAPPTEASPAEHDHVTPGTAARRDEAASAYQAAHPPVPGETRFAVAGPDLAGERQGGVWIGPMEDDGAAAPRLAVVAETPADAAPEPAPQRGAHERPCATRLCGHLKAQHHYNPRNGTRTRCNACEECPLYTDPEAVTAGAP
jgi:hypothetical protein